MKFFLLLGILFFVVGWWSAHGVKSQLVRVLDVLVFGPVLIWVAWSIRHRSTPFSILLLLFGATTMSYNARNFAIQERWMNEDNMRHE